jgi:hypothetical protein
VIIRETAHELGILPPQLQSITWETKRHDGPSTIDLTQDAEYGAPRLFVWPIAANSRAMSRSDLRWPFGELVELAILNLYQPAEIDGIPSRHVVHLADIVLFSAISYLADSSNGAESCPVGCWRLSDLGDYSDSESCPAGVPRRPGRSFLAGRWCSQPRWNS